MFTIRYISSLYSHSLVLVTGYLIHHFLNSLLWLYLSWKFDWFHMIYNLTAITISDLLYILPRNWGICFELKSYLENNRSVRAQTLGKSRSIKVLIFSKGIENSNIFMCISLDNKWLCYSFKDDQYCADSENWSWFVFGFLHVLLHEQFKITVLKYTSF